MAGIRFAFRPRYCTMSDLFGPSTELNPQCDSDILPRDGRSAQAPDPWCKACSDAPQVTGSQALALIRTPTWPPPSHHTSPPLTPCLVLCLPSRSFSLLLTLRRLPKPSSLISTLTARFLVSPLAARRPRNTSPKDAPHVPVWPPLPLIPVASNPKVSCYTPSEADNSPSPPPRYPFMSVIRAAGAQFTERPGRCSGARTALSDVHR